MAAGGKAEGAFLTIREVSDALGVPQHILRYWETRFPQLKPLQRAGNRRYYRPEDVALARRIRDLLAEDGYSMRGVRAVLDSASPSAPAPTSVPDAGAAPANGDAQSWRVELLSIRQALSSLLA